MTLVKYRHHLPQLDDDRLFLTDGGLETVLIFHEGIDLPSFAAFDLLKDEQGTETLRRYYAPYAELARELGAGFVLESPTWRASLGWAPDLGYSVDELEAMNRRAIALMEDIRSEYETEASPFVISGCLGPEADGYHPDTLMTAEMGEGYHGFQMAAFADTTADMATAITMTHTGEAIGLVRAAVLVGLPLAVSFTVETDGRLPSGQPLGEAIEQVDRETDRAPVYYMVNCAHPNHFAHVLEEDAMWRDRIRGVRPNASTMSHAELDEAEDLDDGDPADLGARCAELRARLPRLRVLGGCCGTDHRHVREMSKAWVSGSAP